jgi:hypothetical protein
MTILKFSLTEAKAYFFYAIECESGNSTRLNFKNKEKGGLLAGTIVEAEVEKNSDGYEFIKLISEKIPDGREKVLVEVGQYKPGDEYDTTVIKGLGKQFIKDGKRVQYAYFK